MYLHFTFLLIYVRYSTYDFLLHEQWARHENVGFNVPLRVNRLFDTPPHLSSPTFASPPASFLPQKKVTVYLYLSFTPLPSSFLVLV